MNEEVKISKSELESIMNQLKQTQRETASTIAVQPARPIHLFPNFQLVKSWIWRIGILVIISLVIFFACYVYLQKETIKSATAVESIQKLSTLATAQAHIKTIISEKDNKLFGKSIPFDIPVPGAKRVLFLSFPGDVTAGVDLKKLTKKDITLDTDKKAIHITLPHATIVQEPSIDLKKVEIFSYEGIFRSKPEGDKWYKLEDFAKQKIEKEATENFGLLKIAENNARAALQDIFKNFNYTVTVTFK